MEHHQSSYWEQPFSQPYFDNTTKRETTTTVGQSAYLHCRVRNLGDRAVSYIYIYIYIYIHTHTHIVYATLHKIYIYSVLFFVLILSVHVIVSRSNNLPSAILFLPSNSLVVEPRLRLCIRNFKDPSLPSHHPRRAYLSLHGEPENRQKFPSF